MARKAAGSFYFSEKLMHYVEMTSKPDISIKVEIAFYPQSKWSLLRNSSVGDWFIRPPAFYDDIYYAVTTTKSLLDTVGHSEKICAGFIHTNNDDPKYKQPLIRFADDLILLGHVNITPNQLARLPEKPSSAVLKKRGMSVRFNLDRK